MPNPIDRTKDTAGSSDVEAAIEHLGRGIRGSREETTRLVDRVLEGAVDLDAFGRWLLALAALGESADEIAGVATALRARMLPVASRQRIVADTCGTGGDGSGSFNISTAAAIVAAATGLPVAKHGNRAVSSRTGSGDVLEQLGVRIDASPETTARCLDQIGLCFCLAPVHHPALARVGPLRRSLGRPTVFNLVGPLCNPAAATVQVIGVGRPAAREPLAQAAMLLGAQRVLVVSGGIAGDDEQAFDEVSLFGPTAVIDVSPAGTVQHRWTPEDFGLPTQPAARLEDLAVAGPAESAAAIRAVLSGAPGPRRDIVLLNAAAVLWAAGQAPDLKAARSRAETAIDSGAAARKLDQLAARSHGTPAEERA
ncbi:MAG: anthranilate phosphoribosyltransferase [Planctomycetota bacterium]